MCKQWLDALTDFAVIPQTSTPYLLSPPGILPYEQLVRNWLGKTEQLKHSGCLSLVHNGRDRQFSERAPAGKVEITGTEPLASLEASHPQTLIHQTWWLPTKKFGQPSIVQGERQGSRKAKVAGLWSQAKENT